jgi:SAM-dependent methyltransferase
MKSEFELRYLTGDAPWDTGETPPEVKAQIEGGKLPPGRALDLGCGTGTNTIYLAQHGWEGVGVDFAWLAILQARWKAWRAGVDVRFHRADVSRMPFLERPFDLALDIGCLHSLPSEKRTPYAAEVTRLVVPGGRYLLYAFTPRPDRPGAAPEEVRNLFTPAFRIERQEGGEDPTGSSSAWYWLHKSS